MSNLIRVGIFSSVAIIALFVIQACTTLSPQREAFQEATVHSILYQPGNEYGWTGSYESVHKGYSGRYEKGLLINDSPLARRRDIHWAALEYDDLTGTATRYGPSGSALGPSTKTC